MPKKLTELLREAVAKSQTEEGRRELREQRETPEKPTGNPRLDVILARLAAKAVEEEARKAAEAAIEPQSGPESGRSDSSRGKGRVESAENAPEAPGVRPVKRPDPILPRIRVEEHPSREEAGAATGPSCLLKDSSRRWGGGPQGGGEPFSGPSREDHPSPPPAAVPDCPQASTDSRVDGHHLTGRPRGLTPA